jgi:hypothetical protein
MNRKERYEYLMRDWNAFMELWKKIGEKEHNDVREKYLPRYKDGMFTLNQLIKCTTFGHDNLKTLCNRFFWSGLLFKLDERNQDSVKHYFVSVTTPRGQYKMLKNLLNSVVSQIENPGVEELSNHIQELILHLEEINPEFTQIGMPDVVGIKTKKEEPDEQQ